MNNTNVTHKKESGHFRWHGKPGLLLVSILALTCQGGVARGQTESSPGPSAPGTMAGPDDPVIVADASAGKPPLPGQPDPALVQKVARFMDEYLTLLSEKSSDTDTQYYEGGVWHFKNVDKAWAMQTGPGVAAAVLWKWRETHPAGMDAAAKARQPWLHKVAVETFDRAIKDHLNPDGSFDNKEKPDTYFFGVELGMAYLELRDSLDDETRRRWSDALEKGVNYLIESGGLPNDHLSEYLKTTWKVNGWYTNGNIELGEAEMLYMAWKITGKQQYKDLYEKQWSLTMIPDIRRWKGFGLYYLKQPTKADGSDGAAYLAESGGKEPGYDGGYSLLDADVLGRLYLISRDPRVLRLLNLVANDALAHVDQETWIFDATNGTRHSLKTPFGVCALPVAAWLGNRSDFLPMLTPQFDKGIRPSAHGNAVQNWGSAGHYRAYGNSIAVWLQAASAAEREASGPAGTKTGR